MLLNTWRISFPGNCLNKTGNLYVFFCLILGLFFHVLIITGCGGSLYKSPKALLKTFCNAYNAGDDKLLKSCGIVEYVLDKIARERFDSDGNPYYTKVEQLWFQIISINQGRIGIQKEYSKKKALVEVRFYSKANPFYEKKVTILMSQKKSTTSAPMRWQIVLLPK